MEEQRIDIIIKEIQYWKAHRLLPETYCDFLLALYTNGEEAENPGDSEHKGGFQKLLFIAQILFLSLLVPFSFIVIYFTKFPPIMQISILIIFLAFAFMMYRHMNRTSSSFKHVALIDCLIIVLLITVFLSNTYLRFRWSEEAVILLNSFVWIFYGQYRKLSYLKVAGILGLAFMILYNVL